MGVAHKQELAEETSTTYLSFHPGSPSIWHMRVSQIRDTILGVLRMRIIFFVSILGSKLHEAENLDTPYPGLQVPALKY